ncbi:DUF1150 family protein [Azospirillum sp. SYSU D00513]|uniref:DUF1150 family protein n=1 Tax=Azospirillum sp. SYSU D00513 TaxID=2812561 RepID=UPI001A959AE8|nr:DUF1150 family protein [Azospirillum sp. SYSU D00513]
MNDSLHLREISAQDFASFGLDHVAYVRPVTVHGIDAFGVYAADGTQLTVVPGRDAAFTAIVQNDMEPVSLH